MLTKTPNHTLARKVSGWPNRCELARAFLWEYSEKRLELAQLLGQLGDFLTVVPPKPQAVELRTTMSAHTSPSPAPRSPMSTHTSTSPPSSSPPPLDSPIARAPHRAGEVGGSWESPEPHVRPLASPTQGLPCAVSATVHALALDDNASCTRDRITLNADFLKMSRKVQTSPKND